MRKIIFWSTLEAAFSAFASERDALECFANSEQAFAFVRMMRWPEEVICPHCRSSSCHFLPGRQVWQCAWCRRQFSAKTGTIMADSALSLGQWLTAAWMVAHDNERLRVCDLRHALGITQKTARVLLERIRAAKLKGMFEIVELSRNAPKTIQFGATAECKRIFLDAVGNER